MQKALSSIRVRNRSLGRLHCRLRGRPWAQGRLWCISNPGQPILFRTWMLAAMWASNLPDGKEHRGPRNSYQNPLKHKSLVLSGALATTIGPEKLLQVCGPTPAYNSLGPFCGASLDRSLRTLRKCHKESTSFPIDNDFGSLSDNDLVR